MPSPRSSRSEASVDAEAQGALRAAYERLEGSADALSFRSWGSVGVRTTCRRRFTALLAAGRPRLVAKQPLDDDDDGVRREWESLRSLSLPAEIHHPTPVERLRSGFIMSWAPSVDLPDVLMEQSDPEGFGRILSGVVERLAVLHGRATGDGGGRETARRYVDAPHEGTPRLRQALDTALVGPTHGDLAPWNLRLHVPTSRLTFIDWEDYRPRGIVALDILNLLLTLGLVVFPEQRERGWDWMYDRVLTSDHWYAGLVRRELVHYAGCTGQPARRVIDLLPFFCQWLMVRITRTGRDPSGLYYARFRERYLASPPAWVEALPDA